MSYEITQISTGNVIVDNLSIDDALRTVKHFEDDDKKNGVYVKDFYVIKISENKPVVGEGCRLNSVCNVPTNDEGEE